MLQQRKEPQVDNNNPVQPPVQTQTTPIVPPVPTPSAEAGSRKMILMLVVGMIVVLVIVGGIYYFLSRQQPTPTTQTTTVAPGQPPLAQVKDALDRELDSINVSASEDDFKSVDQDLQSL